MCSSLVCLAFIPFETKDKLPLNSGKGEKGNFCDGDTAMLTHPGVTMNKLPTSSAPTATAQELSASCPSLAGPLWCHWPWPERAAMGKERPIPFHKLLA